MNLEDLNPPTTTSPAPIPLPVPGESLGDGGAPGWAHSTATDRGRRCVEHRAAIDTIGLFDNTTDTMEVVLFQGVEVDFDVTGLDWWTSPPQIRLQVTGTVVVHPPVELDFPAAIGLATALVQAVARWTGRDFSEVVEHVGVDASTIRAAASPGWNQLDALVKWMDPTRREPGK